MLKKTITYEDLDGNSLTEDFFFNMTKAEIAAMELSQKGGLLEYLQRIVADEDGAAVIATFRALICKSVGTRSEDGKRFIKSDVISEEFSQTGAYSELFMELVTEADAGAAFVRGIIPASLAKQIAAGEPLTQLPVDPDKKAKTKEKPLEEYTEAELVAMPKEQFDALVGTDAQKMSHEHLVVAMKRRVQ